MTTPPTIHTPPTTGEKREKTRGVSVQLPVSLIRALHAYSIRTGIKKSRIVADALRAVVG